MSRDNYSDLAEMWCECCAALPDHVIRCQVGHLQAPNDSDAELKPLHHPLQKKGQSEFINGFFSVTGS